VSVEKDLWSGCFLILLELIGVDLVKVEPLNDALEEVDSLAVAAEDDHLVLLVDIQELEQVD
jgi:hypothetical protein